MPDSCYVTIIFVSRLWPRDVDSLIGIVPEFCVVFREQLLSLQNLLVQLSLAKRKLSNHQFKISAIFSFAPALSATVFDFVQSSTE
jgi:hypothetical protein